MKYILITFPRSQYLMEEEWFNECILMNDENHLLDIGGSAYFVPEKRIVELQIALQNESELNALESQSPE